MADLKNGATYADAIIFALDFAKNEPLIFMVTVPVTIFGLIIGTVFWLRFVATNRIGLQQKEFDNVRLQHRKPQNLLLPP